jgi:hypothetical protein
MKKLYLLIIAGFFPALSFAQTLTDGLMMPKKDLCTGFMYTFDRWTNYWEGELNRKNGNIGTITTQNIMWIGTYGVTDRLNVLVTLPYVWTKASQGTMGGMEGLQDVSLGVKYNFYAFRSEAVTFKTFASLNLALPVTDYTPDYLPLAIGSASKRVSYRLNTYLRFQQGWFANASAAWTWRGNVTLDRPAHYYDGQLINSEEAFLPNTFDIFVSGGYHKGALQVEANYIQMNTLGGDDIGRQVMPEVGNRMNSIKVGATVMYYLPKPQGMAVRGAGSYTVAGRNVGESTTIMAGVLYTIHFSKKTSDTQNQ